MMHPDLTQIKAWCKAREYKYVDPWPNMRYYYEIQRESTPEREDWFHVKISHTIVFQEVCGILMDADGYEWREG
jgi:hypothetical protein